MDILNLLEVLKPASHIVTVKMDSNSSIWDSVSKVLIAILPAFISFIALLFSYFQFKVNIRNQSEQYTLGIEQQLKTLKLNTQLATEIELKKDVCKDVRLAYVDFIKHHLEQYQAKNEYKELLDKNDLVSNARCSELHKLIMDKSQLIMEAKFLLDSYLDLNDPDARDLYDCLNEVSDIAFSGGDGTGSDLGTAMGKCGQKCFRFIEKIRKEITGLVDTIGN
ncbi:hypothetical protein QYE92_19220 [Enterobacter cloacae subsp. cloacae]|uniref:hypothetical protein n=1 Tax=Enterobacter cloacae TaxID=550 RepID=UPI0028763C32|nr:hypothetical protein [Enterobacter cloacae]MDR9973396.1 hypothetical protein [Enterobacter cloacae subsp. cloacae]MDS0087746.1 hypothetical protein [Enterobacter cloacae subsp. cloacae]